MFEVEKMGKMVITAHILCTLKHGYDSDDFVEGSVGFLWEVVA